MIKKTVAIIGSGPSALMLASTLNPEKFETIIYEQNIAPARKFLVAGQGGFNLTHSEAPELLSSRYLPSHFFDAALLAFSNTDLCDWLSKIGIPTYTGSSKRVFPEKGIKPIEVLNAFLTKIRSNHTEIKTRHTWKGWDPHGAHLFDTEGLRLKVKADISIFALGGGSWPITGSDGKWAGIFSEKGIKVLPFQSSNCGVGIQWPHGLPGETEGHAMKNIRISAGDQYKDGELVITRFGLEGGALYALIPLIRSSLHENGIAEIYLDLKPQLTKEDVLSKIASRTSNHSISHRLREQVKLSEVQMKILKLCVAREDFINPSAISDKIKKLPLRINALAPVEEAISTVGGISLSETDKHFQLHKMPGTYCVGEMLDWDAPTGGYLLQACFSMGYYLSCHLNTAH